MCDIRTTHGKSGAGRGARQLTFPRSSDRVVANAVTRQAVASNRATSLARMGLRPLELSHNGTVLLACAAAEFHCPPVIFLVPRGVGASFDVTIRRLQRAGELATAADLSRDGRSVLFTVGPFDSPVGDRVYAMRLDAGEPRLLVRNASEANWAR